MPPKTPVTIDDSPAASPRPMPDVYVAPRPRGADNAVGMAAIVGDISADGIETSGLSGEQKAHAINLLQSIEPQHVLYPRDISKFSLAARRQLRIAYRWLVEELEAKGTVTVVIGYEIEKFLNSPERRDQLATIAAHGYLCGTYMAMDLCTRYKHFVYAVPYTQINQAQ